MKAKVIIIHNDAELLELLNNDKYIWHPESFPKVKFSKEYLESTQFDLNEIKKHGN